MVFVLPSEAPSAIVVSWPVVSLFTLHVAEPSNNTAPRFRRRPTSIHSIAEKGYSRQPGFRRIGFSETRRHNQKPRLSTPKASKDIRFSLPHPTLLTTSIEPPYCSGSFFT